ncbi:MAG: CPBP family intramembrane glutamic endopeptidase [Candidatus Micrarchaeota archaeon]
MLETILITASLILLPIFLLLFFEKKQTKQLTSELGLKTRKPILTLYRAIRIFLLLFIVLFILVQALAVLGLTDSEKVAFKLKETSSITLLMALTLTPFAEELFFRGYLVPRTGVFLSAVLFGVLHYGYGSITEIIGAFIAAIIIGFEFKKNKDLLACFLGHALYNASTLAIIFVFLP